MSRTPLRPRSAGGTKGGFGCLGSALAGLVVLAFTASMLTVIVTIAIWPGEAKLVAPLVCPDGQPDGIVVYDTYNVRPGETVTNFTLYCMGPRGENTDVGFLVPFALLTGFHAALLLALVVPLTFLSRLRRRRKSTTLAADAPSAAGAPSTASPGEPVAESQGSSEVETDFEPPGPVIT